MQGSVSIFDYTPIILVAGSQVIKTFNLNVTETKRGVAYKQRCDRFASVGEHIHANPTFEQAWTTPRNTVIEGS